MSRAPFSQSIAARTRNAGRGGARDRIPILLIEDRAEERALLEGVLAEIGRVVIASSAGEALEELSKQECAVAVMRAELDGIEELQARFRTRKGHPSWPPVVFIGSTCAGSFAPLTDFVPVPVDAEMLRNRVSLFLELARRNRKIQQQADLLRQAKERFYAQQVQETVSRLEAEAKRNRFFILSIDMLCIAGFDGLFKELNPSWKFALGYTDTDLQNRELLGFVHPDDRANTRKQIFEMKERGQPVYFENRFAAQDGTYRWLAWTGAPVLAEKLLYLVARDITERRRVEEKVQALNRALESRAAQLEKTNQELHREIGERNRIESALRESNAELESFSFSVSHDLRAPLRAMQGFAEALLEDYGPSLEPTARDYAERIMGAASRMDNLIQDLLLYSRISHASLDIREIDLDGVLNEAMMHLEAPIAETGAQLTVEKDLGCVAGHNGTLVQVVSNLISNAIKFVAPGTKPAVEIRSEQRDAVRRVWIIDNGIGIAPQYFSQIFRVFERLHGVEAFPGTGIGLAIVRKGIERLGGRVGVDSAPGEGSHFWFELPVANVETHRVPVSS